MDKRSLLSTLYDGVASFIVLIHGGMALAGIFFSTLYYFITHFFGAQGTQDSTARQDYGIPSTGKRAGSASDQGYQWRFLIFFFFFLFKRMGNGKRCFWGGQAF